MLSAFIYRHTQVPPLLKYPTSLWIRAFPVSLSCSPFLLLTYGLIQSRGQCSRSLGGQLYLTGTLSHTPAHVIQPQTSLSSAICCGISSNSTGNQRKLFPSSLFLLRVNIMNIYAIMLTVNWHIQAKLPKGNVQSDCHLVVIILGWRSFIFPLDRGSVCLSLHCSAQLVS